LPKKVRQAAVLLDFNDTVDDEKIRKFEDFKRRQELRQQN
jgi:hypothetical protein